MNRLLVAVSLLGFAANGFGAELSAVEVTTLVRKVHAAVMLVVMADESGRTLGAGTGFVVSSDGKLVTNRHVASAGTRAVARTAGGRTLAVLGVLAEDSDQDLVVLQLDGRDLPALTLGDTTGLAEGTPVLMFGNPLMEAGTAMEGTVVGFQQLGSTRRWIAISAAAALNGRELTPKIVHGDGLQVVTPVARGASGSPVLDRDGVVIGVVAALRRANGTDTTFAIPVEAVKAVLGRANQAAEPKPLGQLVSQGRNAR